MAGGLIGEMPIFPETYSLMFENPQCYGWKELQVWIIPCFSTSQHKIQFEQWVSHMLLPKMGIGAKQVAAPKQSREQSAE